MVVGSETAEPFGVRVDEQDDRTVVALTGELDLTTVPQVEAAMATASISERLLVDVRDLTFIDSSGIRLLMSLDLRSREEGWSFVLARRRGGVVHRVLELCSFDDRVQTID